MIRVSMGKLCSPQFAELLHVLETTVGSLLTQQKLLQAEVSDTHMYHFVC